MSKQIKHIKMPKPKKYERKKKFVERCIPKLMEEGKTQRQAIAICYSMYENKQKNANRQNTRKHDGQSQK